MYGRGILACFGQLWLFDYSITQVEIFAGLDGEVLADLDALVRHVHRRWVADPVDGARDEVGQGDAAVGVGAGKSR